MVNLIDAHWYVVQADHDVTIVRLVVDSLVDQTKIEHLEQQLIGELAAAEAALVVDCQQLDGPVSSRFLGLLISLRKKATERHLKFALCGLNGALAEVFEKTRLNTLFVVFDASQPAVRDLARFDRREQRRNDRQRRREAEESSVWHRWSATLAEGETAQLWRAALVGAFCLGAVSWLGWQVGDFLLQDARAKAEALEKLDRMRGTSVGRPQ